MTVIVDRGDGLSVKRLTSANRFRGLGSVCPMRSLNVFRLQPVLEDRHRAERELDQYSVKLCHRKAD